MTLKQNMLSNGRKILIEVIAESVESAIAAEMGGADRLEVCSGLNVGGVSPNPGLVKMIKEVVKLPLYPMVRPRGGDFVYTNYEFEVMKRDIDLFGEMGVEGVVLGILHPDGKIDCKRTRELIERASPMQVTFHRAFDMSKDPFESMESIIECGATRILTSGHHRNLELGMKTLTELNQRAAGRIILLPGGGLTADMAKDIVIKAGLRECHFSAKKLIESHMQFRNPRMYSSPDQPSSELPFYTVDEEKVRELRTILDSITLKLA